MEFVQKILDFGHRIATESSFLIAVLVGVIAFTALYYFLFRFLNKNKSNFLSTIFILCLFIIAGVFLLCNITGILFILVPAIFVLLVISLYSVEIKRAIWARKKLKFSDQNGGNLYDKESIERCINEIIKALQDMSKNDVGAIIVLSSGNVPDQVLNSGVKLDSEVSSELIESVFFPKTPLHDGAMIINGSKIVAAGCFLPLAQNMEKIPKDLGTRHRAGLGITETIDVVSLIVSEETGIISIAKAGNLTRYADTEMLRKTLNKYYWKEVESTRR